MVFAKSGERKVHLVVDLFCLMNSDFYFVYLIFDGAQRSGE